MRSVGLAVVVLAMSACSKSGGDPTPDMATGGISAVLTLWHPYHASGQEQGALTEVLTSIRAKNPNLQVKVVPMDLNQISTSWEQEVMSGRGPDLYVAPNDKLGAEVAKQTLADITSLVDGKLGPVSQLAIDGMTVDGKIYGVPQVIRAVALYYNKSKVATPPTTLAQLQALVAGGNKLVIPQNAYDLYWLWGAFGGVIMDNSGHCQAMQNNGVTQALQYMADLQAAGASFTKDGAAADAAFESGATDMIVNGPSVLNDYRSALGANVGVVPLPAGTAAAAPLVGIDGFYVNPNSNNKDAAVQLGLLISDYAGEQVYAELAGDPPVRSDVPAKPLVAVFQRITGISRPQSAPFGNYGSPFGTAIDSVLSTTAPVDAATAAQTACTAMDQANNF